MICIVGRVYLLMTYCTLVLYRSTWDKNMRSVLAQGGELHGSLLFTLRGRGGSWLPHVHTYSTTRLDQDTPSVRKMHI